MPTSIENHQRYGLGTGQIAGKDQQQTKEKKFSDLAPKNQTMPRPQSLSSRGDNPLPRPKTSQKQPIILLLKQFNRHSPPPAKQTAPPGRSKNSRHQRVHPQKQQDHPAEPTHQSQKVREGRETQV